MGHIIFMVLHIVALFFLAWALVVTVPLHIIYTALASRGAPDRPTRATHVRCPDCQELILKEARVCKHCGCKLIPLTG